MSLITVLRHVWSARLGVSTSQCRPGTVYPPCQSNVHSKEVESGGTVLRTDVTK